MRGKDNQEGIKPSILLRKYFQFEPTAGQQEFFIRMNGFLDDKDPSADTFILRGYAGTGKTSLISSLVKVLPRFKLKSMLLAPTGRAAKVMGNYSNRSAFTIHKIIYRPKGKEGDLGAGFDLMKNYYQDTVFIVDEASMLADDAGGGRSLLRDLIQFVFQVESNKMILVGDTAQLPPVGSSLSPALDRDYLSRHFRLKTEMIELKEVMRQQLESGILFNATYLRDQVLAKVPNIFFRTKGFKDFFKMTGERLEDGLRYAYGKYGVENTAIVTRSNKTAVQYNQYIRQTIHFFDDEISAGDLLMIVKNNYTYMADSEKVNFLANGDFIEVAKIRSFEEMYGLRFATLELRLVDYPEEPLFEAKVILDTLYSPHPALTVEEYRELYRKVSEDYLDVVNKSERLELIKKDPYLSALQVKFAYALTCHKSQGGQWDAVFVDQGYLTEEQVNHEYIRWLYTAVTRAKKELFMVNFNAKFYLSTNENES
ncbi:RecD-like DNA helicase [Indibacter alkaliphilus LW1]|jgi:ATP-dependent exoDNAse (exonuclease V) alpha subunit|uniref:RecD-like DNA helicase n=1 Tax=Indibacter alkaliphilus (strain CCUG 57479 / KCTC 22604 / LW1) TaxID=1189612 RepID=S2DRZ5_INDAL|nr:ATP-binding domain-containing protein [Indibacter alkaliphilus]EOZ92628.1 RecD-like DNA helicase [Indibacter alkaliphilus LW1]